MDYYKCYQTLNNTTSDTIEFLNKKYICSETIFAQTSLPKINRVIFNGPATIVFWADGDKTIVKCTEEDFYDPEKGLAMAICKKALGEDFRKTFKKFVKEKEEPMSEETQGLLDELVNNLAKRRW